jgi:hypothetical protein
MNQLSLLFHLISIYSPVSAFKLLVALFPCFLYLGVAQKSTADFPNVTFTDVTAKTGITFEHVTGAFGKKYMPETMCSGCAFLDYDGDERLDILLINGNNWPWLKKEPEPTMALYRNLGNGTFEDVTRKAGLNHPMYGMGCTAADYDNDGDTDIYITNLGKNRLYRNNGDGTFTDVTDFAKVGDESWSSSVAFFDYDKDSFLDLFVCNYVEWTPETDIWCTVDGKTKAYCTPGLYTGQSCRLYHNKGDGTFEDATEKAGIYNPIGKSLGVALLDVDSDGWLDLAVANDTAPNFLYRNNGKGLFSEEAMLLGMAFDENGKPRGGMGIDAADYLNNDGLAVSIGNFSNEMIGFFYIPGADDFFTDNAVQAKIGHQSLFYLTFGLFFFDYDLDGYLDLFFVNGHIETEIGDIQQNIFYKQRPLLFWNLKDGTFAEVGEHIAALNRPTVSRGVAYGDYDSDGDLDILISNNGVKPGFGRPWLLRNDGGNQNNFLRVKTVGVQSNRDGIGAKVIVKAGGITRTQLVHTGSSYCSQSELTLTFGLGKIEKIDLVKVIWPSGQISQFPDVKPNSVITVVEGKKE